MLTYPLLWSMIVLELRCLGKFFDLLSKLQNGPSFPNAWGKHLGDCSPTGSPNLGLQSSRIPFMYSQKSPTKKPRVWTLCSTRLRGPKNLLLIASDLEDWGKILIFEMYTRLQGPEAQKCEFYYEIKCFHLITKYIDWSSKLQVAGQSFCVILLWKVSVDIMTYNWSSSLLSQRIRKSLYLVLLGEEG